MNDDPLVLEMIADEVVKWERYRTGRPLAPVDDERSTSADGVTR